MERSAAAFDDAPVFDAGGHKAAIALKTGSGVVERCRVESWFAV